MLSYNQIYGLRTVGAGSWMSNKLFKKNLTDPFSKVVINSFKKPISLDLKRIGLLKKIKNLEIMDVGTGRQALAFLEMGAKAVDLYDISKHNINKIKKLVKEKKSFKFKRADICKKNFNKKKKYDLIYLQGIIQHTKKPKS